MLTVVAPADSHRLTTVAAVKAELALSGGGDDAWLADAIDRASAAIRRYVNRSLAVEEVEEVLRIPSPAEVLSLVRWPAVSVASVVEAGTTLTAADFETDTESGMIYRLDGADSRSRWAAGKIVVTYSGGFTLPGTSGRTLPEDIERAAVVTVRAWYHGRHRDPALRSETVEGLGAATYLDAVITAALPPEAEALLAPYRMVAVG